MDQNALPSILTLEQAAEYLQLEADELRACLERGEVPGTQIANKWRIKRQHLDELFERGRTLERPSDALPADPGIEGDPQAAEGPTSPPQQLPSDQAAPPDPATEANLTAPGPATEANLAAAPDPEAQPPTQPEPEAEAEPPASPRLVIPPPSRMQGRIFTFNAKQGFGYARLPDGRVIWIDSKHIVTPGITPASGDLVEFEQHRSPKRLLEARNIHFIEHETLVDPTLPESAKEPPPPLPAEPPPPRAIEPARTLPPGPKTPSSPPGSHRAQQIYSQAAVARTEGRIEDARRLFKQAISVGGGTQVYEAFIKMETEKGSPNEARRIFPEAIGAFPDYINFYVMYGQMERRAKNYSKAEEVFRSGMARFPDHVQLNVGLWQTLVELGTDQSIKEAQDIFRKLDARGKINVHDVLYQRFKTLQNNPRANRAYGFFRNAGWKVGIASRRDMPQHITDITVEIENAELKDSYNLSGIFLVRCFTRKPSQIEIVDLKNRLHHMGFGQQNVLGLQDREVVLNTSLAFVVVPNRDAVHDQIMSILSDSSEAIVPLDDRVLQGNQPTLQAIRDLLGQYLGVRDLYSNTMPVYGRRFFGREQKLRQLANDLKQGQFIGIYGLRKIGKTSFIYQLRDEKLLGGGVVAYVDLQASLALTMNICEPLYWELERDLYTRLLDISPQASNLLRLGKIERFSDLLPDMAKQVGLIFNEDMRSLLDLISQQAIPDLQRLIIVLDELERLLPIGGQPGVAGYLEFFGLLRGLAQNERYRGLLSSVVVAANASISERGYWEGRENPVFALYRSEFLTPLSEIDCIDMIRTLGKNMSVYWENDAIKFVFDETGGHPFLTRSLCSRIIKQNPNRPLMVNIDMVQEQINPFIRDESDKFEQITELLRTNFPEEETLLEQIALDDIPGQISDQSIRHLLGYHLVSLKNDGYQITLSILRRWLRRRAGIKE